MKSAWAKIFGWMSFGVALFGQFSQMMMTAQPHGAFGWIGAGASLLTAIAIHGASSTDGQK